MTQKPAKSGNVNDLLARANKQIQQADTKEKLRELILTYESVLHTDPVNYEALWSLSRYYGVMGWGYAENIREKKIDYTKAIQYAERALYTNPDFKKLVDQGERPWNACSVLTSNEIEAVFYWFSNTASHWKECQSWFGRMVNISWTSRTKKMITRAMELAPEWGGGHPYYAWAVYYTELPGFLGGDMEKAEQYFNSAMKAGPNWLYIRYGRAQYFYTKKKDKEGFRNDLEWVIAQDPHKADSPYPANVCFQRNAKEMLDNIENYF